MPEPIAYYCGEFIPSSQLVIAPQDTGFMLGVTVAEQLRTFGGKLFAWHEHLSRLSRSLDIMGLRDKVDLESLLLAAEEVTRHNHALLEDGDDVGVTVFITPGRFATYTQGDESSSPTVGIHTYPLPFSLWAKAYETGQRCIISSVPQISARSWPRELKCRSRAHYYLAEQQAQQVDPQARAILLDEHGEVNEASTANVVAYFAHEGLVSPPRGEVLPGISLNHLEQLAAELGIEFTDRRLTVEELRAADEILLTSTPFCILPVSALDNQPLHQPSTHIAARLLTAWSDTVDVDIVGQAQRFSRRP